MNIAPVFHSAKFSIAKIAEALHIEPFTDGGISYGVLKLNIPLNNGTYLEFRDGDDIDDNEVSILPTQETLDKLTIIGKPFNLSCYDLVAKLKENHLRHNHYEIGNESWERYNNWGIHQGYNYKNFFDACRNNVDSAKCGICDGLNLQFDDCGFFYKMHNGEYVPFCGECGKPDTCER